MGQGGGHQPVGKRKTFMRPAEKTPDGVCFAFPMGYAYPEVIIARKRTGLFIPGLISVKDACKKSPRDVYYFQYEHIEGDCMKKTSLKRMSFSIEEELFCLS